MLDFETEAGRAPCPDSIAVVGGGRWARVLVDVLCDLVPLSVTISVHSRHNRDSMVAWADAKGRTRRIQSSSDWPPTLAADSSAVIVANAARDHEVAAEWALSAGIPVLVEKPICLSLSAARRLADLAHNRNARFAAAHIFLFARYLENFSKLVRKTKPVEALHIDWADPRNEERYGERKRFDPSLPVFADWLPHIVPVVGTLLSKLPNDCSRSEVRRGGAALELELMAGSIPCTVRMERNAQQRRRIFKVVAGGETLQLDFSTEPGIITHGSSPSVADQYWDSRTRPAARMLTAFLKWAAGGGGDSRLDYRPGLQACKIIDQVSEMYRSEQISWLIARLETRAPLGEEVRYALAELLQAEGPLAAGEVDRYITASVTHFSGKDGARRLMELIGSHDAARRSINRTTVDH